MNGSRALPFVAAGLLWLLAAAIAWGVEAGAMCGFDAALLLGIAGPVRAGGWGVPVLLLATMLGSAAVRLPVAAAVAGWLAWRGERRGALVLLAATIGTLAGNALLKTVVGRPRPDLLPHLAVETSLSFPSGHAANAAGVFLAMAWGFRRAGAGRGVWPAALLLVAAVGVSRIVLGVHWPTDVIAGWCVGAGWMLACVGVAGSLGQRTRSDQQGDSYERRP